MSESVVLKNTIKGNKFDAVTKIGFNAVNLEYKSNVSFVRSEKDGVIKYKVLTQAEEGSSIFNYLDSTWTIETISNEKCEVDYSI